MKRKRLRHLDEVKHALEMLYMAQRRLNEAYDTWLTMLEYGGAEDMSGCRGLVGELVDDETIDAAVLFSLRLSGLRPRDIEPGCDLRPATEAQRKAIVRLCGVVFDGMTFSQAAERIRSLQHAREIQPRDADKVDGQRTDELERAAF